MQRHPPTHTHTHTPFLTPLLACVPSLLQALFRYGSEVVATATVCPHQGGPLALGDIEDVGGQLCVTCPWHGFKFNVRTGTSVMPKEVRLREARARCTGAGVRECVRVCAGHHVR